MSQLSTQSPQAGPSADHEAPDRFAAVRSQTERIIAPLAVEDTVIQSMPDTSPAKWHLGHVTWFFETFLLKEFLPGYRVHHEAFAFLFNSYYENAGPRVLRPTRGLMSRPTLREVLDYRAAVDKAMLTLIARMESHEMNAEINRRLEIGLHHEQQHQELLYMDIKHVLFTNYLRPTYLPEVAYANERAASGPRSLRFADFSGGLFEFGTDDARFAYDNESPRHRVFLEDYRLADRLITNGEYLEFILDGGYGDFRHWLSDGWDLVRTHGWQAPLYWEQHDDEWWEFTLHGPRPLRPAEPVCHLSFHEAWAYAAWAGCRLPTEFEWEHAASRVTVHEGDNILETGPLHPRPDRGPEDDRAKMETTAAAGAYVRQLFGDVWEWTQSAYLPYPGFRPESGALGEYNGKFMNDQRVLRGGCAVTPRSHIRLTYRNFFQADKRWPFTGLRLAAEAHGGQR